MNAKKMIAQARRIVLQEQVFHDPLPALEEALNRILGSAENHIDTAALIALAIAVLECEAQSDQMH